MKGDDDKRGTTKKICQNEKYYKIKADFSYLQNFNYEITKELGRGGYGVVYKVGGSLFRHTISQTLRRSSPSRSTSTQSPESSSTLRWHSCS